MLWKVYLQKWGQIVRPKNLCSWILSSLELKFNFFGFSGTDSSLLRNLRIATTWCGWVWKPGFRGQPRGEDNPQKPLLLGFSEKNLGLVIFDATHNRNVGQPYKHWGYRCRKSVSSDDAALISLAWLQLSYRWSAPQTTVGRFTRDWRNTEFVGQQKKSRASSVYGGNSGSAPQETWPKLHPFPFLGL